MEKKNKKGFSPLYLAGSIVVISCFLFLLAGILRFGVKNVLIDRGHADSDSMNKLIYILYSDNPGAEATQGRPPAMNWEGLYPFEEEGIEQVAAKPSNKITEKISMMKTKISSVETKISHYFEDELLGRKMLLEFGEVLENTMHWGTAEQIKKEPYIFWGEKTGHISRCMYKVDVTAAADNLADFAYWVQKQGIPFVYVQYPAKMSGVKSEQLPTGFFDYTDENADALIGKLEEYKVPFLDIREDIISKDANIMFGSFFRTDHHWLPQVGLEAAGLMAQYLQEKGLELNESIFNPENYTVKVYEGIYLGSYGRDVTAGLIDPDDFPIVTPNFDTHIKISIPNRHVEKEGTFEETLLNLDMLYPRPSYDLNQYDIYCWGDCPLTTIENESSQNQSKVLILKDSYGSVVAPYLALSFGETTLIDLRAFTGSIRGFIEEYRPDYVIVAYNPGLISETATSPAHTSLWDFR